MQFDMLGLERLIESLGQKAYRGRQLAEWLYCRGAASFAEMDTLPQNLRQLLSENYVFSKLRVLERLEDRDGTVRYVVDLGDGHITETVALPSQKRLTVCFSTQVGCALGCVFCATGRLGLTRSLLTGEMLSQLAIVASDFPDTRISNVVAMGQGEPFANYEATLGALRMINNPAFFGVGARHITVSSAGLITQIQRFADESEQFTLAISLHSAEQSVRNYLMPGLRAQPLDALREALLSYLQKTSRRPSLEYALVEGVNDTPQALASLIAFCDVPAPGFHVNLLGLNTTTPFASPESAAKRTSPLQRARSSSFAHFEKALSRAGVSVSRRVSKGEAIAAACGQLASQHKDTAGSE